MIFCILCGKVSPFTIPALLGNTASGVIGIECGCQGPNYGITSACASGGHAIGKKINLEYVTKTCLRTENVINTKKFFEF